MADSNGSSLTVSAYSQKFFQSYSESVEPTSDDAHNKELAGQTFLNLVKKLYEAGSKEDVRVPLRVLRDEIGRIHFGSVQHRDLRIEKLFELYDALEEGVQEEIRTRSGKEAAWATYVLEELRQRFSRLVVGDTWEAWPELKLQALKHMHRYMVKEKTEKPKPPITPARQSSSNRLGMKKLSRSFSGSPQMISNWQTTFDDLAKAPGSRLLPLIRILLNPKVQGAEATQETVPVPGTPGNDTQHKDPLRTQASGISEGGLGRPMAELDINMDDLLGLNDSPFETVKPDPFRASLDKSLPAKPSEKPVQQLQPLSPPSQMNNAPPTRIPSIPPPQTGSMQSPSKQQRTQNDVQQHRSVPFGAPKEAAPDLSFSQQSAGQSASRPAGTQLSTAGSGGLVKIPQNLGSIGTGNNDPGSFNPFDLPSPTYSSPVPNYVDNSFAEFSPIAGAPVQPKIFNPMRAPPEPPTKNISPRGSGHPQPPPSSFSSW